MPSVPPERVSIQPSPNVHHIVFRNDATLVYDPDERQVQPWLDEITPPADLRGNVMCRLVSAYIDGALYGPTEVRLVWGANTRTTDAPTGDSADTIALLTRPTAELVGVPGAWHHRFVPEGPAPLSLQFYDYGYYTRPKIEGVAGALGVFYPFFQKTFFVVEIVKVD